MIGESFIDWSLAKEWLNRGQKRAFKLFLNSSTQKSVFIDTTKTFFWPWWSTHSRFPLRRLKFTTCWLHRIIWNRFSNANFIKNSSFIDWYKICPVFFTGQKYVCFIYCCVILKYKNVGLKHVSIKNVTVPFLDHWSIKKSQSKFEINKKSPLPIIKSSRL